LERRGREASGRTKHIAIRYLWIAERVKNGEISVEHKETELMVAGMLTKRLDTERFLKLRRMIMNEK
jgi:hypothetical protein